MSIEFPKGSEWRRWDLHVHTPASYNSRYRDWDQFLKEIKAKAIEHDVHVVGINDYFTIDGYEKILSLCDGTDPTPYFNISSNRQLYFIPMVELRLHIFDHQQTAINVHVAFDPGIPISQIRENFFAQLNISYSDEEYPLTDASLISIGHSMDNGLPVDASLDYDKLSPEEKKQYRTTALSIITLSSSMVGIRKKLEKHFSRHFLIFIAKRGYGSLDNFQWYDEDPKQLSRSGNTKRVMLNHSDICFSSDPQDRTFLLGQGPDDEKYIRNKFRSLKPCVWGSDAHEAETLLHPSRGHTRRYTWIKADPTFSGLQQLIFEPEGRVFIGDKPPSLVSISENQTKYIASHSIKRNSTSKGEIWFDECNVVLNCGLIAVIGRKGSGKSALVDSIGLLANSKLFKHFSFLKKFNEGAERYGEQFIAETIWLSGKKYKNLLSSQPNLNEPEIIKYIPQSYLEKICSDLSDFKSSLFRNELEEVIFSHLDETETLDFDNLRQLLENHTEISNKHLTSLRQKLYDLNMNIITLEDWIHPNEQAKRKALLHSKQEDFDIHIKNEPLRVLPPAEKQADSKLSALLKTKTTLLGKLDEEIKQVKAQKKISTERLIQANKVKERLAQFELDAVEMLSELRELSSGLEIEIADLISFSFDSSLLDTLIRTEKDTLEGIDNQLDQTIEDGLAARLATTTGEHAKLLTKLDEPNQLYQQYLAAYQEWDVKKSAIDGNADTSGSLKWLAEQVNRQKRQDRELNALRKRREYVSSEIHTEILKLATGWREFYKKAQKKLNDHKLAEGRFSLEFDVSLLQTGFTDRFFSMIRHYLGNSEFRGEDIGIRNLREILDRTKFGDTKSTIAFIQDIIEKLIVSFEASKKTKAILGEHLKKGSTVEDLYNFLFSLEYLEPHYVLNWSGKNISKLSPGERGIVLLIFYLILDTNTKPLVFDQPEENLDNESVYDTLTHCINDAKNRRQVIMVTQNPNLAVVCDADQVIYCRLDKEGGNRITYYSGSIENPRINQHLVNVLEGTMPAFDKRNIKYFRGRILS